MKFTVLPKDKTVCVDDVHAFLETFEWGPFATVHAVQGNPERDRVEIEFREIDPDGDGPLPSYKPPNELMRYEDFVGRFGDVVSAWQQADKGLPASAGMAPAGVPRRDTATLAALESTVETVSSIDARMAVLEAKLALLEEHVGRQQEAFRLLDQIATPGDKP